MFFCNSKFYLKNMQISLHHIYKSITWLFTYFPFSTLISQLNTKNTRKTHSQFNLVVNMVSFGWHVRWCPCEGISYQEISYLAPPPRYHALKSNMSTTISTWDISGAEQDIKQFYIGYNSPSFKILWTKFET